MHSCLRDGLVCLFGVLALVVSLNGWRRVRERTKDRADLAAAVRLAQGLTWILGMVLFAWLIGSPATVGLAPFLVVWYLLDAWPGKRGKPRTAADRCILMVVVLGLASIAGFAVLIGLVASSGSSSRTGHSLLILALSEVPATMALILAVLGWLLHRNLRRPVRPGWDSAGHAPVDGPAARPTLLQGMGLRRSFWKQRALIADGPSDGREHRCTRPADYMLLAFALLLLNIFDMMANMITGVEDHCLFIEAGLFFLMIRCCLPTPDVTTGMGSTESIRPLR